MFSNEAAFKLTGNEHKQKSQQLTALIHKSKQQQAQELFQCALRRSKNCIETAMEGTTIKIGSKKHTFEVTIRQVTAALDPSGRLMLE
ncbi:hypothetical protein [Priestia megaterium]|uniref:hypothetical protein n=1 Tax=Priestia megaterium TaxID=1404 RepID=UPI002E21D1AA|nr:hypothetical protein [Priestia megaterium]